MSFDNIQKIIDEQKKNLEKAAEQIKDAPANEKVKPEKILQLVREELASVEKELAKYSDKL
ncbi:hypothetical protein QA584_21485 [Anaerocolumna sp. AGMB13025]|jgi:hypothetical protein|uniref:hypothetical protein n=1 Tax=Anaerocolumna sp. AGMB13025 TaxID=3039116 RepID=UPI00241DDCE6|nr:hypothetical protein [Anaerocolumna sp. AGMB13025]WFR56166.1 hypothetical protein QA584_21485 [Anaerocolumna sp. AGMB13025]